MEALRTQNDSLQWEVNRLDAENRILRSENPDRSARVDLEIKLEQTKKDVETLTKQFQACQSQLAELPASREEDDDVAAQDAEELERTRSDLRTATAETAELRETNAGLVEELAESRARESELLRLNEGLTKDREADLLELPEPIELEKESALRDAELVRYRALEAERNRWEARKLRLVEQLETVRHELDKRENGTGVDEGVVTTMKRKLVAVEN